MSESAEFPLSEVPRHQRRGFFSISFVLFSFTFFTGTMFAGGVIGTNFTFLNMLWVSALGNVLLALYASVLALIASRSGLSTVLIGRFCFGEIGSKLFDMILGFAELGWYAWGTAMLAISLCTLLELPEWIKYPLMIVLGLGFCITALVGFKGLDLLSRFSVPLMLVLLIVSMVKATYFAGGWQGLVNLVPKEAGSPMGWSAAVTIVFGTFASGATQATNWTRLSRSGRVAIAASFISFLGGNGLMIVAGGWCAIVYQNADIVQVMIGQGLSIAAIVMLCLNLWSSQGPTIYNTSVAACNLIRTGRRRTVTLMSAVVGIVLAVCGMSDMLVPFLKLLGTIIPPIGGVIMADYWFGYRGRYPKLKDVTLPNFNLQGLMAYAIGAFLACCSPWLAPVVGIISAAAAHIILGVFGMNRSRVHRL